MRTIAKLKVGWLNIKSLFADEADGNSLINSLKAKTNVPWALGLALVVTLFAALFFLGVVPARFGTNDDTAMAGMAYGYNGQYSSYLVFINVVVGMMLEGCLTVLPTVPWYTIFQLVLICAALVILLFLLFQKFGVQSIFPATLLLSYFGYEFLSRMQFSKTAGISVVAGFLLLFDANKNKKSVFIYLLGASMVIAGSLYRFKVFEMLCIPFFGVGIQMLWGAIKERDIKKLLRLCIPFIAVFAVCFGLRALDSWTYQRDEQWASYREFNSLRSQLLDYGFPNYEENQGLYESLGITKNDLSMYRNWEIADPDRFNVEIMRKLVDAKETRQFNWALIRGFVEEITLGMLKYWHFSAFLIVLFMCLLLSEGKKHLFLLVYLCVSFCFEQLYLYYEGRYLQGHVDVSIILAITMILLLCICPRQIFSQRWMAALMAGLVLMASIPQYLVYLSVERQESKRAYIFQMFRTDPEHLYMGSLSDSGTLFTMMWDPGTVGIRANHVTPAGWLTNSPYKLKVFNAYGIENPYRDIVNNQNVYFVCNSGLNMRLTYIQEHYAPEANAYLVKNINGDCKLYRIATAETPPEGIEYAKTVSREDGINYDVNLQQLKKNNIEISGYLYAEGANSFVSNIYIALRTPDGKEHFHYTTQSAAAFSDDVMNGAYSAFSRTFEQQRPGTSVVLYLETDGALYRVETNIIL